MADGTRKDRLLVAAIVAFSTAGTACCGCGGVVRALLDGPDAEAAAVVRPVRTLEVARSEGALTRSFTGTARAGEQARLSFKVPGLVNDVRVKVGDTVTAGQLIAKLEPTDLALQVQQLDAAFAQADAVARNATATLERVRSLFAEQNASQADLDAARAAAESATARANAARKQRALASVQLGYTTLEATRTGAVVEVLANPGENVAAGQPVVTLASGNRPEVAIGVPASLIARVTLGQPASAVFGSLGRRAWSAKVTEVGVAAAGSATFPVIVTLDGETDEVKPGMPAEITIDFPATERREYVRVPAVAVAEDALGTHLWVVEPGADDRGTVRRRPVVLGELTSEGIDIVDGLHPGELVVTGGVARVHDAEVIRLLAGEAAAGGPHEFAP